MLFIHVGLKISALLFFHLISRELCCLFRYWRVGHRRKIKTDEKAKVVAAICGTECIQLFTVLAIFH